VILQILSSSALPYKRGINGAVHHMFSNPSCAIAHPSAKPVSTQVCTVKRRKYSECKGIAGTVCPVRANHWYAIYKARHCSCSSRIPRPFPAQALQCLVSPKIVELDNPMRISMHCNKSLHMGVRLPSPKCTRRSHTMNGWWDICLHDKLQSIYFFTRLPWGSLKPPLSSRSEE
jgi:hypothetical protein